MSNTYCPLPWNHFSTHADGQMRVCCNSTHAGRLIDDKEIPITIDKISNIIEFYNIGQLKQLRKNMLLGIRSPECNICYQIEDNGGHSIRNNFEKKWPIELFLKNTDISTGEIKNAVINYLDLSWSNKCNLQCRMCSPSASNQLIKEATILNLHKINSDTIINFDFEKLWKYDNIEYIISQVIGPNLKEILVTGGEPLINNDFYKFCKLLISNNLAKNIALSIHSNLTVLPDKWLTIFSDFKYFTCKASIDAIEDVYEYIRYPGKWKIVDANIMKMVDYVGLHENTGLEFHTVLSINNMERFTELLDYFIIISTNRRVLSIPHVNYIYYPEFASPSNCPQDYKIKIATEINDWINKNKPYITDDGCLQKISILESQTQSLVNSATTEEKIINVVNIIKQMDNYRNNNSAKFLPWITDYINENNR